MTRAELLALAKRVEAAPGADRELDIRIGWMLDGGGFSENDVQYAVENKHATAVTPFTSSLDAAASLVPEGWTVASIGQGDDKTWFAELRKGWRTSYSSVVIAPKNYNATTPALALTAACLRAKAREGRDGP